MWILQRCFACYYGLYCRWVSLFINKLFENSLWGFDYLDSWFKEIKSNNNERDIKVFLIGNKTGLEKKRVIKTEQGLKKKNDFKFDIFMEVDTNSGFDPKILYIEACKILYQDFFEATESNESHVKFDKLNKYLNF